MSVAAVVEEFATIRPEPCWISRFSGLTVRKADLRHKSGTIADGKLLMQVNKQGQAHGTAFVKVMQIRPLIDSMPP